MTRSTTRRTSRRVKGLRRRAPDDERPMNAAHSRPGGPNRERSFGLSVGGVLIVIAALLVWRGRIARAEIVGAVGALLVLGGALAPKLLKWPSDAWWAF